MEFTPKNGRIHAYFHTEVATKGLRTVKQFDPYYTDKLNEILDEIQENGYEIVDVKIMSGYSQGLDSLVRTLVLYK